MKPLYLKYYFCLFFVLNIVANLIAQTSDFTEEEMFTSGIEGPATDKYGNIYAVNFGEEGTIGKVDPKGNVELFIKLPQGSIGNGIRFDKKGDMFIADYVGHNILKVSINSTNIEVFAHESAANQPNDLAISPNSQIFASDPNWQNNTGNLWRVEQGNFVLLEREMGTTNGIEVSPDGSKLYVNESIQRKIWVYDLSLTGEISNKKLFYNFDDFGLDGMRTDANGNLYVCRYGAGKVVILSPKGKLLKTIMLIGKNPTNITFGGENNDQCFVTLADRGCIEQFKALFSDRE
ncbi:SMP-30/gluconolactonase/LRE family protein [Namhaeicola litoreus]|uniref:SMP-30/gluconolactonase/LRE family protein n=1 Tax=Namhaeicola litoreus TaxID=1052145 RepID=A0ABW3Y2K3_9FLAO